MEFTAGVLVGLAVFLYIYRKVVEDEEKEIRENQRRELNRRLSTQMTGCRITGYF